MEITADGAIEQILQVRPDFLASAKNLNTTIAPGDGMLDAGDIALRYYFECGRSALDLIDTALLHQNKTRLNIGSVLDFACGYGRVTRWLKAGFHKAKLSAYDVDPQAVNSIKANFAIECELIDQSWQNVPATQFDLIWVGSLFTHLDEARAKDLAKLLFLRLKPGGILAATFHGRYVAERIRSGQKTYGIEDRKAELLDGFDKFGYGFSSYPKMTHYGISVTSLKKAAELMESAKLEMYLYLARGWVKHQDFVACCR